MTSRRFRIEQPETPQKPTLDSSEEIARIAASVEDQWARIGTPDEQAEAHTFKGVPTVMGYDQQSEWPWEDDHWDGV